MSCEANSPRVSIIALIHSSPNYATSFYKHLLESTPELQTGEAEFFFVANNANLSTKRALRSNSIPHVEFQRRVLTEAEQVELGFGGPEYIGRVYAAYNFGVSVAKGEIVAFLNSDMIMSRGWLSKLVKFADDATIPSPILVERRHPRFGLFPGAIERDLGSNFKNFKSKEWEVFIYEAKHKVSTSPPITQPPYMPSLLRKEWFLRFGGFPEGNLIGEKGFGTVSQFGDEFFFTRLSERGINHISIDGVFCYHFKEGERSSNVLVWWGNIFKPQIFLALSRVKRFALGWLGRH
jgi:GT2 family glycosyltransferase